MHIPKYIDSHQMPISLSQSTPLGFLGGSGATVASPAEMGTGIGAEDAQVV